MPTDSAALRLLPHLRRAALGRDADTGDAQFLGEFVATHDEAAFAALVRRHGPMVLGVCRRVIGDPHLAEDAFQATFLVLARRAAVVRPRHLVGHWLYGVAYRTALKARGSAARRAAKEKQVDAMPQPPVSPDEAWADLQAVLDAELARLPDKYRIPVVLCDLGGRPQREVARELRLPPATLANRLAAARRLLAKRLTDRGVVLSAGAIAAALGWHAATSAVPATLAMTTVKAACAAAAGSAVGLPIPVVQLSEGVMRMFVLNKLKTVAGAVATGLLLLAALGIVAAPSLRADPAGQPPKPVPIAPKSPERPADPSKPPPEDLVFLRRTSLDLRGTLPSTLEAHYFLTDKDPQKRDKVVRWMLPEHGHLKTTDACQKCHTAPALSQIPYLNRLFVNPHRVAVGDFDNDGRLDMFVANGLGMKLSLGDPPAADKLTKQAELAAAEVQAAEVQLKLLEQKKAASDPKVTDAQVDEARAKLAGARATAHVAEHQAKAAEAWAKAQPSQPKPVDKGLERRWLDELIDVAKPEPTDAEFMRRLSLDIRGVPPSLIEMNYFVADKDPKKREKVLRLMVATDKPATASEKLVQDLMADPEVQKRWMQLWQQKLYQEQIQAAHAAWMKKESADRLDRLLSGLLDTKKMDDEILNALCLATMARYPSETERKFILDGLHRRTDRPEAWKDVLYLLTTTAEAKAHAVELSKRSGK